MARSLSQRLREPGSPTRGTLMGGWHLMGRLQLGGIVGVPRVRVMARHVAGAGIAARQRFQVWRCRRTWAILSFPIVTAGSVFVAVRLCDSAAGSFLESSLLSQDQNRPLRLRQKYHSVKRKQKRTAEPSFSRETTRVVAVIRPTPALSLILLRFACDASRPDRPEPFP